MMYKKIKSISGVYSGLKIDLNRITYFTNGFKFNFVSTKDLELKSSLFFKRDYEYMFIDNLLYVFSDDELQIIDVNTLELTNKIKSDKQYIKALSLNRYLAMSYIRKEKEYDNIIINENSEIIWSLKGNYLPRDIYKQYLLLSDRKGNNIALLDYMKGKMIWEKQLNQQINGVSIDAQRLIIIPLLHSLIAVNKNDGNIVWSKSDTLFHYNFDEKRKRIYGLGVKHFEAINIENGVKELTSEFDINIQISSHLTHYSDGLLYFSTHLDNNIPIFGAVNIKTGELEFIQEVEIEGEKSFRIGLEKPIVVDNRLYVKDSQNNLHIFEKEKSP